MFADMSRNHFAMLWVRMSQDVLDEVVAILVAGNVDEGDAGPVNAALTDTVEIAAEKLDSSDLEALLHYLGCKLVHAVLCGISDDMVDSAAAIGRGAVLADVLNAPVAKLAMGNDVDVG